MKDENSLKQKVKILDENEMRRALNRISYEIIERNENLENVLLVGIKSRGIPLAEMIKNKIDEEEKFDLEIEKLDISLYRDDLSLINDQPIVTDKAFSTDVDRKDIILVDDVLYTGRTVRAAIDAIFRMGRPNSVQLAVLIDRGHRELPIKADYIGKNVPTSSREVIAVRIPPYNTTTEVVILELDNKNWFYPLNLRDFLKQIGGKYNV